MIILLVGSNYEVFASNLTNLDRYVGSFYTFITTLIYMESVICKGSQMLDPLDRQILETISKAPFIVRSVTEKEIRSGVLLPSITTLDIKRNLPRNVDVDIIEGRLNALEGEGYIYYEENRWWLTTKGKKAIGIGDTKPPSSGPIREVLEETFSKFEAEQQKPSRKESSGSEQFGEEIEQARDELLETTRVKETDEELETKPEDIIASITERLNLSDRRLRELMTMRREELLKEIEELKSKLERKRKELEDVEKVIRGGETS